MSLILTHKGLEVLRVEWTGSAYDGAAEITGRAALKQRLEAMLARGFIRLDTSMGPGQNDPKQYEVVDGYLAALRDELNAKEGDDYAVMVEGREPEIVSMPNDDGFEY